MLNKLDWLAKCNQLRLHNQAYINGEFIVPSHQQTFECINPANGKCLVEIYHSQLDEVNTAVKSAREAFDTGRWCDSPQERKAVLLKFAALLAEHSHELALLDSLDMGKPVRESFQFDVPAAVKTVAWYAEAIDKVYGEIATTDKSAMGLIMREPLGVVGAIVPWNFPLLMACWKIAPALACGNCVVLKPSEKASLSALRLASLASQAGLPRGVLNILPGYGNSTGKSLALHDDVDCITFTGSTRTGKKIIQYAAQSNMKRTFLECGGKSPNIVFADCYDLDKVAEAQARAIFYNQGQVCTAASRLLVESNIKEMLIEKIIEHARTMQPGDPLDETSFMGAIVDKTQLYRLMQYIATGIDEGAVLRFGGERVYEQTGGYYLTPTIFDQVTDAMTLFKEELFGPILAVTSFETEQEAIKLANQSQYGLAGAVWSSNFAKCHRVAKAIRAGSVSINCWLGGDMTVPFGGMKQSGNGRDKSLHAMHEYSELKSTWISLE